jgi:hypothetical protein
LLYDVVRDRLVDSPRIVESTRARVEEPISAPPRVADVLGRLVERPKTREQRSETMIADTPRPSRPLANYLEIEARNRRLGLAGEEFAIRFEEERLWRGDGEGYDILSFEESGEERLIEVKTTTFGPYTPLFVTRNEVDVSEERADEYYIYRLFNFRDDPKLFFVPGEIAMSFDLEATQFVARLA